MIRALLSERSESKRARSLVRRSRKGDAERSLLIAYDFETSRIAPGTPRPLYLTAFALHRMHYAERIDSLDHLRLMLRNHFLTPELKGARFVAWYGNGFDAYFVAAALLADEDFVIRPYMTRSYSLRGLKIIRRADVNKPSTLVKGWEFLDGQSMLGLAGVPLAKFLANFAPDHAKLTGIVDFEREEFDPDNPDHCRYAMRDSEGLWHAMERAQSILIEHFNEPLSVTMGAAGVRIFMANIPEGVEIATPRDLILELLRTQVMRGGFCYCARRYHGPVWKYDLNQAYAAAMREAALPCGFTSRAEPRAGQPYIALVDATIAGNVVPFYYRRHDGTRLRSVFSTDHIEHSWLTSIEVDQLRAEGWSVKVSDCWVWEGSFSMRDFVDRLETLRMNAPGGPAGPQGTMVKMVGNHSYGKTVEVVEPVEYIIASQPLPGFAQFYGDEVEPFPFVWYRFDDERRPKDYHKPHIGAFITAHVRMVVRRAALLDPEAWLYADTDCVVFSRSVTDRLDIDAKRYGAWKLEEDGTVYRIIAKKVYAQDADEQTRAEWDKLTKAERAKRMKASSKGMSPSKLRPEDFDAWFAGAPPTQAQVQRQNFMAVMRGAEMYRLQDRGGTKVVP